MLSGNCFVTLVTGSGEWFDPEVEHVISVDYSLTRALPATRTSPEEPAILDFECGEIEKILGREMSLAEYEKVEEQISDHINEHYKQRGMY